MKVNQQPFGANISSPKPLSPKQKIKKIEEEITLAQKMLQQLGKKNTFGKKNTPAVRTQITRKIEKLDVEYVHASFSAKKIDSDFSLSEKAKKVFETAKKITQFTPQIQDPTSYILNHGREYAFLASKRHHLDKHILKLEEWGGECSKVQIDKQGNLFLPTYPKQKMERHSIINMMEQAEAHPDIQFDLTQFSCTLKKQTETMKKFEPSFKVPGDGNFYAEIVTFCKQRDVPTLTENHAWLRMIDAKGNVYSIGKFPKQYPNPHIYRQEETVYATADRYEWLIEKNDQRVRAHRFRLTKSEFKEMKNDVQNELDVVHSPNIKKKADFNVFHENCSDWALNKVCKYIPINKNEFQVDQFTLLIPQFDRLYRKHVPKKLKRVLTPIKDLCSFLTLQIPRLILMFFLGGTKTNKANPNSKPSLRPSRFLSRQLTHVTHPKLMSDWLDENIHKLQRPEVFS